MRKLLLLAALLVGAASYSQGISVNPNAYTTNQLVNTVLVKNSCLAQVSNISKSTGTDFGYSSGNGIGYFTNTNPNFPMTSGVVLTSGNAVAAQGPNTNVSSFTATAWGGDTAFDATMAAAGLPTISKNATSLEFDFVAATTSLSINYLFASEEYGTYQCESKDGVVILLTNIGTGVTTNIAVTPTNQPVSVATIRNILNNSGCASQNPALFGQFNGGGNAAAAAINYEGQTVMMNASATLVEGAAYHIKVVVADDGGTAGTDGEYDSAVFFPEGAFDVGQMVVGNSFTQAANTALCTGDTYTIATGLNENVYNLSWTRNGSPFAGGATVNITQSGNYVLTITNPNTGCTTTESAAIEFAPPIVPNPANDLYACDTGAATYAYDLSLNTPVILQGLNPATVVTYHTSQANADGNVNALPALYTGTPGQTLYARVKSHNSSCYAVVSFQLLTMTQPTATQPASLSQCESAPGSGTATFNLTQLSATILGSQSASENSIAFFTSQANADNNTNPITTAGSYTGGSQTIYVRVSRNFSINCYATTSFNLVVTPIPVITDPEDVTACDSYTLPNLTTGGYFSSPNGVGPIAQGTILTTSQTVYIYAQTATTPACTAQTSFYVNVVTGASVPEDVTACSTYTLPALPDGQYYYAQPGGAGAPIAAGTVITATQQIYFYVPAAATCTQNASFMVNIVQPPVIDDPADVNECSSYTLPALTNGGYYSAANGVGPIAAGTAITTTQTIYVYAADPNVATCTSQNSFTVTINNVDVSPIADITRCGFYALPALTGGAAYYSQPNGVSPIVSANVITTQTIYVYAQAPDNPACFDQESFVVTINPLPVLDPIPNVSACGSYVLPALPAGVNYYNGNNPNTATVIPAGTTITTTQNIYAITPTNEFGCRRTRQFTVTIIGNTPPANPGNQNVCTSYTLPELASGSYWTGTNGTGIQRFAGDVITTSQTLYVYVSSTNPPCSAQSSFTITITTPPNIPAIPNVVACGSYTLPALAVGNYYTQPNGGGTMMPAGTVLTTNQTVYAWAQTGGTPNCTRQRTFTVTIINGSIAPADVTACSSYVLPAPTIGGYFSSPNGVGPIAAGTTISATQTIYVYAPVNSGPNCTANNSFVVAITNQPVIPDPEDVSACGSYTLPVLSNGEYWTGPNGTGTQRFANDVITSSQIMYVYASNPNVANCTSQNSFNITINNIDVADVPDQLVCTEYVLPQLQFGSYYTSPGGVGPIAAGTAITTDQTIYIYAQTNTTPPCSDEESFTVTIKPSPVIPDPGYVVVCGSYILPALTEGTYYTGPNATGTVYPAGTEITSTQDIYIYAESGGTPNCIVENVFSVVINPEPPADVAACDSYILPELPFGQYFTAPAGQGTELFAGTIITTTQDIYVFVDTNETPNCTDNNFFTVTINQTPNLAPVEDVEACDVYILPELALGNYYTGPGGTGTLLAAGDEITSSQTVYVYAQTATSPNCTDEESFNVTIHVTPVADARSDVEICFEYTLDALTVGNYFELPGGPNVPGQVPHFAGEVITDDITLYIYAVSDTSDACFSENSFSIDIYSIDADGPFDAPVEACDSYTLPPLTVGDYYALSGGPDVPNQVLYSQGDVITASATLYVYAELGGRLNCNDENPLEIIIYQTPVVDDTQQDLSVCFEYILPELTVGNYFTQPMGGGQQLTAGQSINGSATLYIYAETGSDTHTCFDQHSYHVTVNSVSLEEFDDVIYSCENYTLPDLVVGDFFTQAGGQGTLLPAGTVITDSQTLYMYAETGTTPNCTDEDQFDLIIVQPPVPAATPGPLYTCGIDDVGHGIFNLQPALDAVWGNQPNVTVGIYETLSDAQFEENAIPSDELTDYENNNAFTQTLYIGLGSTLAEGCYTIVELQLIVNPRPQAITPAEPYALCDNGNDDSDGISVFDLTLYADEVLGTMDPALFTVSYFDTPGAAELGTPVIATPASYNSDSKTIYIRVTNNATGCYDIVELELIVNPLPEANQPESYSLCDVNPVGGPANAVEEFDLTTTIPFITGGFDGVTVTFHHSYNDAVGQVGAITNPDTYENQGGPVEAIFVRVTDNETGCYRIVIQDIRVEPLPVLVMPAPEDATGCDTDGDGVATFNLDDLIEDMVNNGVNITVAFYETYQNALDGVLPIPNPAAYNNANEFTQIIYVVATNTETGCISAPYELVLTVNPAPQAPDLEDITQCDDQDNDGQDNHAWFDLTIYEAFIYAETEADPGTLTIHYFDDEDFANNGQPRITNPAHYNGEDDEVIWVRVENTATGCYSLTSFQLHLNRPWLLNTPTQLTMCNEALDENGQNDTFTTFDLTVKELEILGPMGIGVGNVVTYYETEADAQQGINFITPATAYVNESNPQIIYVRVVTPDGCVSFTTLSIRVLPLPTPNTEPDALELCDENATGDGVESFDLTLAEDNIGDNDFTVTFTYYPTEADAYAEPPTNEITQPETYVSATGSVWVRVSANTNNASDPVCYQVVELPLIVHPLPAQGTIAPYAICEQNTDGFAQFDFNTHMDEILGPDVDPADYDDYTVSFSYNGQPVPYIYTNVVAGSQTIDVNVVYEPTECETDVQLTLLVEEQAIAYDVTTPDFDVCDTDGTNDGTTTVDLTQADADIIGTQDPAIHAVSYYETEADAIAGTNAIANPAAFDATTQTIWARIVNTSTVSGCPDFTSFEVVIELLPEPEITTAGDNHTICVDFATGDVIRPLLLQSGVTPNGHTYDWYLDGALVESNQNGTYLAVAPGTYTVEVTGPAPNNCVSDLSQGFEVLQSGPPSAIGEGFVVSNAFGDEQTITVLVEGYGEYQYSLYPEGPWQNSNVFTNVSPGEHYVYIRDVSTADPCTDEGYHLPAIVSVINYPHYFTPNGDGYNDTWNIIGLQAEGYQAIIYIFDRYGKLIKQISPDGEGWDGTFNGNPVPADDYWFTVEFNEGDYRRTFKAHFAVKR